MTEKTKKLVLAALMCALTCVATMVIRIPTPTMGYIHPGDALVLLCAFLLGPVPGALAAGIGSMLSELFSGYLSYVPATFIIKALTALLAGVIACGHKKAAGGTMQGTVYDVINNVVKHMDKQLRQEEP